MQSRFQFAALLSQINGPKYCNKFRISWRDLLTNTGIDISSHDIEYNTARASIKLKSINFSFK